MLYNFAMYSSNSSCCLQFILYYYDNYDISIFQLNACIGSQEIEYIKKYYNVFIIHIYYLYNIN